MHDALATDSLDATDLEPEVAQRQTDGWTLRLLMLLWALTMNLRQAHLDPELIRRIAVCSPALAAAVIEWRRLETAPNSDFDWILYEELREATGVPTRP